MKTQRFIAVTVGIMVLSVGLLFTAGCGEDDQAVAQQGVATPTDLSGVTQNWNKNLPAAQRFVVLTAFNSAAVLDKHTGLVWEQAPSGSAPWGTLQMNPSDTAPNKCLEKNVGGTVGWRLPSVVELRSLQDPTLPAPFVPESVFTAVSSESYWSATTNAVSERHAWIVGFGNGNVDISDKANSLRFWCVRGGMNADAY